MARSFPRILVAAILTVLFHLPRPADAQPIRVGVWVSGPAGGAAPAGKNLPIAACLLVLAASRRAPGTPDGFDPGRFSRSDFSDPASDVGDAELDRFVSVLKEHPNVEFVSMGNLASAGEEKRWAYLAKRIGSAARGARPTIKIALASESGSPEAEALLRALAADSEAAPYFDAFLLEGPATGFAAGLANRRSRS